MIDWNELLQIYKLELKTNENQFKIFIGENADADNLAANFTVTGDGNVIDVNNDATASDIIRIYASDVSIIMG